MSSSSWARNWAALPGVASLRMKASIRRLLRSRASASSDSSSSASGPARTLRRIPHLYSGRSGWWGGRSLDFDGGQLGSPPSVFVRDLSPEEAQRLRRVSRQSKVFALRQRAQILLASDSQVSAPEIARVLQTDENQVRRVIAEFNLDGMDSLRPPIGAGIRGGSMTTPGRPSGPSPSPVPVISVNLPPAGRFPGCAAT